MRIWVGAIGTAALVASAPAVLRTQTVATGAPERFVMRVVATGLESPWEIAWGPDRQLWVTERQGKRVVRVNPADGSKSIAVSISDVHQSVTQDGLLGLVLHPDLLRGTGDDYVYVSFTYDDAPGAEVVRRLAIRRYRYDQSTRTLMDPTDILRGVPAHDDHVAGRLAMGPDRTLYLSVGDQGSNFGQNRCTPNRAQELPTAADVAGKNWSRYQGKILRIALDGSVPPDNPEIASVRSHVFSYGHRNPLGLAFGPNGLLYESEHGPSSDDEVNLIEAGRNYGWPHVAGFKDDKAYVYSNWSASSPQPCGALPAGDNAPSSVPAQTESAWSDPRFAEPLRTFFTVDTPAAIRGIGSATMAPGGLDVYMADRGVPGWSPSLLALSLIRGTVYRLPLAPNGRSTTAAPIELFRTANRYRDVAVHPDGRTIYLVTDTSGPTRDAAGRVTQMLANPGSILEFTFTDQR